MKKEYMKPEALMYILDGNDICSISDGQDFNDGDIMIEDDF